MSLIAHLRALHTVDSQVRGIKTRFENAEDALRRHELKLDVVSGKRRDLDKQTRQVQAMISNLELEDTTFKERLDHLRAELNTSSNPKIYNALRDELKVVEGKRDELAERIMAQMENLEKLKKELESTDSPSSDQTRLRDMAKATLQEAKIRTRRSTGGT
jgi:predicted  nucleic acid-binding Zn-ribbon protein